MRKLHFSLLSFLVFLFLIPKTNAQETNRGDILDPPPVDETIYQRNHIDNREYLPYTYLREADVMWSKTVWRKMDLKEKMNLVFYYPEIPDSTNIGPRRNLINTLLYGIENGLIQAYTPDNYHEFRSTMSLPEINERMGGGVDTIMVPDVDTGQLTQQIIENEPRSDRVKEVLIKELWFFDKQRSQLEVRIIGLCPIIMTYRQDDIDEEDPIPKKLFWVYYPDVRYLFSHQEVFNPTGNDAERRTFDDLFINRFFSSYIVQESNVYNNRAITEYTIGIESLLEAERIKEKIFNFEQDLWEY